MRSTELRFIWEIRKSSVRNKDEMLRCVLHHRVIFASVSSKAFFSNFNGYYSDLSHFGVHKHLWVGLSGRFILSAKIHVENLRSSAQDLLKGPADGTAQNSMQENEGNIVEPRERKSERHEMRKNQKRKSVATQAENQKKLRKKIALAEDDQELSKKKAPKRKRIKGGMQSENLSLDVELQAVHDSSADSEEDAPPSLSFPFDGSNYSEADDEFNTYLCASTDSSVVHKMDDCRSEDRFYHVSSASASVVFPSVTTVLNNTVTKSQYYRLRNWKRSMIKEHGEEEFENIQQHIKDTGTHFHQVRKFRTNFFLHNYK